MSQNAAHAPFLVALGVQLASRSPNQLENNDTQGGLKMLLGFRNPERYQLSAGKTVPTAHLFRVG